LKGKDDMETTIENKPELQVENPIKDPHISPFYPLFEGSHIDLREVVFIGQIKEAEPEFEDVIKFQLNLVLRSGKNITLSQEYFIEEVNHFNDVDQLVEYRLSKSMEFRKDFESKKSSLISWWKDVG
jgi:hypothetical protein